MSDLKQVFRFRHMQPDVVIQGGWGIYIICHVPTARLYVGSTERSFEQRLHEHLRMLERGTHPNPPLQTDWTQFGKQQFFLGPAIHMQQSSIRYNSYIFEYQFDRWVRDTYGPQFLYNVGPMPNGSPKMHEFRYANSVLEDYFNGSGVPLYLR